MAKILIVEDNLMNCKMIMRILEPLQMQLDTAENGRIALDKIQTGNFDLVLMDHMMPVMDGVEAVTRLKTLEDGRYKDLPVIALSAAAEPETRALFAAAGMNDFVAKPIDKETLFTVLKKWLPQENILQPENGSRESLDGQPNALPVIEGIDVEAGIRNTGSRDNFTELLGVFGRLIDTKSRKILQCMEDGLIKDYTIEVHALKSNARSIGALTLSREFEHLEQLGKAGDVDSIRFKTPVVIKHYRSFQSRLEPFGAMSCEIGDSVPVEELLEYMYQIRESSREFNLNSVDAVFAQLERCKIPELCEGLMEKLRVCIADVDMEQIEAVAREMITLLENERG